MARIQEGLHADLIMAKLREEHAKKLQQEEESKHQPVQEDTEMINTESANKDDVSMIDTAAAG